MAATPLLTFEGAQLVDIDANKPVDQVISAAEQAISEFMAAQGFVPVYEGEPVAHSQ